MFQYSLCRIVYCCEIEVTPCAGGDNVSIFALSNRVLLPTYRGGEHPRGQSFNIRSVESCTAAVQIHSQVTGRPSFNIRSVESCTAAKGVRFTSRGQIEFQYSLCRIVYCCLPRPAQSHAGEVVSIFALSNRVLLLHEHGAILAQGDVSIFALSNRVLLQRVV